jgi:hypothetical protein
MVSGVTAHRCEWIWHRADLDETEWLLWVMGNRTLPRYEHGCGKPCGRRYAGHCPNERNTRPETDPTKSRAGIRPDLPHSYRRSSLVQYAGPTETTLEYSALASEIQYHNGNQTARD